MRLLLLFLCMLGGCQYRTCILRVEVTAFVPAPVCVRTECRFSED